MIHLIGLIIDRIPHIGRQRDLVGRQLKIPGANIIVFFFRYLSHFLTFGVESATLLGFEKIHMN